MQFDFVDKKILDLTLRDLLNVALFMAVVYYVRKALSWIFDKAVQLKARYW